MSDPKNSKLKLNIGKLGVSSDRRDYKARFVRSGNVRAAGNRKSNIIIEPQALAEASVNGLFDAKSVFIDHASFFSYPSLKNLAGVTKNSSYNENDKSVDGEITFYNTEPGNEMINLLDQVLDEDSPPDIGLSIVFYPQWAPRDNAEDPRRIVGITHVESVDLVFEPAADGRILQALSSIADPLPLCPVCENVIDETGACLLCEPKQNSTQGDISMPEEILEEVVEETTENPEVDHVEEWNDALSRSASRAMIQASGLPAASQDHLLTREFASPGDVQAAIDSEQAYLAQLREDQVVQVGGSPPRDEQIVMGRTSLEKLIEAYEALLNGVNPTDVQPLTGIRELYTLLSGDYEMTGVFQPDRITFANVTTSTMANITADLLNKRVMAEFMKYPQWWTPIVNEEDFPSLQDAKWIVLGGVGELPTVAEGAAYTELTWDDQKESDSFVKKGGYLGITIEAIDKDDTGRLRAAPRALAQAAWLTLAKSISDIFTSNSGVGPTMSDSLALFHTTHGNLGTTALSVTTWSAARTAMRKMTEVNSSERLGALTVPKFLLVPPDLEVTALQVLSSAEDYTYALANAPSGRTNVFTEGDEFSARLNFARSRVIVVDLWTDTNNWAAVGDPQLYPTIGLGYRYGRTPEIFSVASPTAGLMFTNDTMPVKVRYFFATGPIDYRNLYKANVA